MFAQTAPAPEIVSWTQLGVMGLVIAAFLTGWVVNRSTHQRALDELDKLTDKAARQDQWIRDDVVPALTRNTDVLQQVLEMLREQLWQKRRE